MEKSQSPSLRGSGRFALPALDPERAQRVSIPFIAGQWSLPSFRRSWPKPNLSLNPLHCGAVVASRALVPGRDMDPFCLNPLHCGAVVASCGPLVRPSNPPPRVSIPFIAGQWSLPLRPPADVGGTSESQSPSLRGSGRFSSAMRSVPTHTIGLNPLHCGAVVASIFFATAALLVAAMSQSPSLRGSGRFASSAPRGSAPTSSQSPSLRGSGRFLEVPPATFCRGRSLNPLHCGAVVASGGGRHNAFPGRVSIPFIAGQWSLRGRPGPPRRQALLSQSPSLRGSGRFLLSEDEWLVLWRGSQSPSLRGSGRFRR